MRYFEATLELKSDLKRRTEAMVASVNKNARFVEAVLHFREDGTVEVDRWIMGVGQGVQRRKTRARIWRQCLKMMKSEMKSWKASCGSSLHFPTLQQFEMIQLEKSCLARY